MGNRHPVGEERVVGLGPTPNQCARCGSDRPSILGCGDGLQRTLQDVGDDLGPHRSHRSAAHRADPLDALSVVEPVLQCPPHLKGHALHDGAQEVSWSVVQAQADERGAGSVVEYRYALSAEPGREQQAIHIVCTVPHHLFHLCVVHRAGLAEPEHAHRPGERRTAGGDFEPEDPLVGLGVRQCPKLVTRIDAPLGHHQAEVDSRTEADVKIARIDCARAQLARRHVADADVHRDVGGQAESMRDIGQEPTGHVSSGADGGKLVGIYPRRLTRVAVPVAGVMGEKPIGRCPGVIGDRHAGEMQDDGFLAVQQLRRPALESG